MKIPPTLGEEGGDVSQRISQMQFAAELQMAELVQQKGSTLQRCQQMMWVAELVITGENSLSQTHSWSYRLAEKTPSLPNLSVGTKRDVQPQLHPRPSTPSLAPVCSNILWPAKELGTGSGWEVGRDAGSSHASLLLPTKTPAPCYSAHALCLVFRSGMVSGQKRSMFCQVIWGEKKTSQQFSESSCNTAVLGG